MGLETARPTSCRPESPPCSCPSHSQHTQPWGPPSHTHRPSHEGQAWAEAGILHWGAPGWMDGVRLLAAPPGVDLVLAADCCYIDQDGESPSTPAFVETCAGLCGPDTLVLVSFERRSPEVGYKDGGGRDRRAIGSSLSSSK